MLEVTWDNGDLETSSTQKIKDGYINASHRQAEVFQQKGDFDKAFNAALVKVVASCDTPYQAHAPMDL